jgi:hypothetical protein
MVETVRKENTQRGMILVARTHAGFNPSNRAIQQQGELLHILVEKRKHRASFAMQRQNPWHTENIVQALQCAASIQSGRSHRLAPLQLLPQQ